MAETLAVRRSLPLTDLSEDEAMFQEAVRDFAEERVRPLVHKMDEELRVDDNGNGQPLEQMRLLAVDRLREGVGLRQVW